MGKRFVFYGLCGICMEVFWTGLGAFFNGDMKLSGFTYIWMFPIYGLAVFLEVVYDKIRSMPLVFRGGVYALLIFVVEFTSGMLLKMIIGLCPWDYSSSRFSVYGVIRLDFLPVWFAAGLFFEKVHISLDKFKIMI